MAACGHSDPSVITKDRRTGKGQRKNAEGRGNENREVLNSLPKQSVLLTCPKRIKRFINDKEMSGFFPNTTSKAQDGDGKTYQELSKKKKFLLFLLFPRGLC